MASLIGLISLFVGALCVLVQPSAHAQTTVLAYEVTLHVTPPFFAGQPPLSFVAGKTAMGMGRMINLYFEFGEFRNTFAYADPALDFLGIAQGATTTDRAGNVLAKARLVGLIRDEPGPGTLRHLEIEELHYSKEQLIFTCKSTIGVPFGLKEKERDVVGRKRRDYYFIWPVRAN